MPCAIVLVRSFSVSKCTAIAVRCTKFPCGYRSRRVRLHEKKCPFPRHALRSDTITRNTDAAAVGCRDITTYIRPIWTDFLFRFRFRDYHLESLRTATKQTPITMPRRNANISVEPCPQKSLPPGILGRISPLTSSPAASRRS